MTADSLDLGILPITVRIAVALQTIGQPVQYNRTATGYTVSALKDGDVMVQAWRADKAERIAICDTAERILTAIGFTVTRAADFVCTNGTVCTSTTLFVSEA